MGLIISEERDWRRVMRKMTLAALVLPHVIQISSGAELFGAKTKSFLYHAIHSKNSRLNGRELRNLGRFLLHPGRALFS